MSHLLLKNQLILFFLSLSVEHPTLFFNQLIHLFPLTFSTTKQLKNHLTIYSISSYFQSFNIISFDFLSFHFLFSSKQNIKEIVLRQYTNMHKHSIIGFSNFSKIFIQRLSTSKRQKVRAKSLFSICQPPT